MMILGFWIMFAGMCLMFVTVVISVAKNNNSESYDNNYRNNNENKSKENFSTIIIPDEIEKRTGTADSLRKVNIDATKKSIKKEVIGENKSFSNNEYEIFNDDYNYKENNEEDPIQDYNPIKRFFKK